MANTHGYEFQSEYHRRLQAEARAELEAQGRAHGTADALLTLLQARGLPVSDEQRVRIAGCTDLELLAQWIRKAATVSSTEELFG
jgi:hypothetical protein